jgi:type I restriction enzyme S subunit
MKEVALSEICDLLNGYAFKSNDYVDFSNTLNCRMSNIRPEGYFDIEYAKKYLPDNYVEKYSGFLINDGDLVIAMTDMANDPKILGVPTIVKTNGYKLLLNQRVGKLIILDKEKVHIPYLQYSLNRKSVKKYYTQFAGGGLQLNVGKKEILSVKIPLPPIPVQQKIAAILDAADELRQKDKALVAKYDELTQALFLDMFGDPVSNPKGWDLKTIEGLTLGKKENIKRGPFGGALKKEIFVDDGYLVYEQFHALNNDFSMARYFIDERKYQELKGFAVEPGDIIISCSGIYLGKLAVIPKNARKGIINQALLKLTLDQQKMTNDFFVHHFTYKNFREKYFDANRGAGIPNFPPMPVFKKFPFITPPIKLQNQFAERVKVIEEQKSIAQASALKSEELFNSLLQKAFNGELL